MKMKMKIFNRRWMGLAQMGGDLLGRGRPRRADFSAVWRCAGGEVEE